MGSCLVMPKISGAWAKYLLEMVIHVHGHCNILRHYSLVLTNLFLSYWQIQLKSCTNILYQKREIYFTRIGKSAANQDLSVRGSSRNDHHREELQRDGVQGDGEGGGEEDEDGRGDGSGGDWAWRSLEQPGGVNCEGDQLGGEGRAGEGGSSSALAPGGRGGPAAPGEQRLDFQMMTIQRIL